VIDIPGSLNDPLRNHLYIPHLFLQNSFQQDFKKPLGALLVLLHRQLVEHKIVQYI
jgi:hypothetical protein